MKKYILILILTFSTVSFAEEFVAIGGNLGSNKGLNFLVYDSIDEAIQINTSFDLADEIGSFTFTLDRVFFSFIDDNSSVYYGVGIKLSNEDDEEFGIRAVTGISAYLVNIDENLEIFGEIDPTIHFASDADFLDFEYGIGLRYYF